jgi:hypothetical protein
MILMPRDGMFSVVVGDYGSGPLSLEEGLGVHQFQDGRWVEVEGRPGVFVVVPTVIVS